VWVMNIRNSAKAIIVNGNQILLTKNEDQEGFFYLFPGGGQEHGETLHEALIRECKEEVGLEVEAGELLHVREYIGKNHEHSSFDLFLHQVEFYFTTKLDYNAIASSQPSNPDHNQVGIEWVPLNQLEKYRIYPKELLENIIQFVNNKKCSVYVGDLN
jgi:8-oxo-dGTP diphosphatase